jgi:hypothetical protein
VSARAGLGRYVFSGDSAGDPLDGLVNLFDIGIVLAVAFLVAGLGLTADAKTHRLERRSTALGAGTPIRAPAHARPESGRGEAVGTVYRLPDGELVYVHTKPSR